jgi:hypothetical protein
MRRDGFDEFDGADDFLGREDGRGFVAEGAKFGEFFFCWF